MKEKLPLQLLQTVMKSPMFEEVNQNKLFHGGPHFVKHVKLSLFVTAQTFRA